MTFDEGTDPVDADADIQDAEIVDAEPSFGEQMLKAGEHFAPELQAVWQHLATTMTDPRTSPIGDRKLEVADSTRVRFDLSTAAGRGRLASSIQVNSPGLLEQIVTTEKGGTTTTRTVRMTQRALSSVLDQYAALAEGHAEIIAEQERAERRARQALERPTEEIVVAGAQEVAQIPDGTYQLPKSGSDWPITAQVLLNAHFAGGAFITYWAGAWFRWTGIAWARVDDDQFTDELRVILNDAVYYDDRTGEHYAWNPNRDTVDQTELAIRAVTRCAKCAPGTWRDHSVHGPVIPHQGGYLEQIDGVWMEKEPSPYLFNLSACQVPYEISGLCPDWLTFLDSIFGDDEDGKASIDLLQEWLGYLLSGRTDLQKALQLLGPARSGKGTIMRVLTALFGMDAIGSTTLGELSRSFGLQGLYGKSVVFVGDAKPGGKGGDANPIERLLTWIGEDLVTVPRKNKDPLDIKMPGRLMFAGNDVLTLADEAGALAARFMFLTTRRSFVGREDGGLTARLTTAESLQGILSWGIAGLDRLAKNDDRFTVVAGAAAEAAADFADQASLTRQFISEHLYASKYPVPFEDVYIAYVTWCKNQGAAPLYKGTLRTKLKQHDVTIGRPGDGPNRPFLVTSHGVKPCLANVFAR